MKQVKVNTDELLETLRVNLEKHRAEHKDAYEGYRAKASIMLSMALKQINEGGEIETNFQLPEPANNSRDYERSIRMLEMSVDKEVTLSDDEFAQYVLDEWHWKGNFRATNAFYSATM